jgi:hypothetical protein
MVHAQGLGNRVTETTVRSEPQPEFTRSWRPFSHAEVLDAMSIAIVDAGLEVGAKEYSLRKPLDEPEAGSKMLACWQLKEKQGSIGRGISIINATDKTAAISIGWYERIFICSNFCFKMELASVLFRRHTGRLSSEEILYDAREALKMLLPKFESLKKWHEALKLTALNAQQAALLTTAAMRRAILPPAKFPSFYDCFIGEASRKYESERGTLWGWHAAATEIMNDNSLLTMVDKQHRLNYFLDYEAPIVLKRGEDYEIDLKAIERAGFEQYKEDQANFKAQLKENSAMIKSNFHDLNLKRKPKELAAPIEEQKPLPKTAAEFTERVQEILSSPAKKKLPATTKEIKEMLAAERKKSEAQKKSAKKKAGKR